MKVRATQAGYYDGYYREPGSVFEIDDRKFPKLDANGKAVTEPALDENGNQKVDTKGRLLTQVKMWGWFSQTWMEKVADDTPVTEILVADKRHPLDNMRPSPTEANTFSEAQKTSQSVI